MTFADNWNTPEAMDKFWSECDPSYFEGRQEFYEMLADRVVQVVPGDCWCVMDIGGAGGRLLYEVYIRMHPRPTTLTIVDYSRDALDLARVYIESRIDGACEVEVRRQDITKDAMLETAIIISSQTLEHIKDYDAALRNMITALFNRGKLILTIPNGANDTYGGHHNFWTVDEFRQVLAQHGTVEVCELMTEHHIFAVVSKE